MELILECKRFLCRDLIIAQVTIYIRIRCVVCVCVFCFIFLARVLVFFLFFFRWHWQPIYYGGQYFSPISTTRNVGCSAPQNRAKLCPGITAMRDFMDSGISLLVWVPPPPLPLLLPTPRQATSLVAEITWGVLGCTFVLNSAVVRQSCRLDCSACCVFLSEPNVQYLVINNGSMDSSAVCMCHNNSGTWYYSQIVTAIGKSQCGGAGGGPLWGPLLV